MTGQLTGQVLVRVRGLTKTYGGRTAVDSVDLDVHAGEIVGLLGANGAGKTTTVECIQGLRPRDGGSVEVLGLDPAVHGDRVRRLVGSQQQESALPDRLRVGEAIALFRGPRAAPVDGLLEAFGLSSEKRTPFSALSGGQRQRLFLVLAVLNRPSMVILDELTQGLDPAARRDVWDAISVLRDAGTTVLLVTHYMDEAEALCDRVVVMRDGRVVDTGTPDQLILRHAAWATVRFGGSAGDRTDPAGGGTRLDRLRSLPGVASVGVVDGTIEVQGDRSSVAYVCADLVHGTVPADLAVVMPDLESAVVSLLTSDIPAQQAAPALITNGALA